MMIANLSNQHSKLIANALIAVALLFSVYRLIQLGQSWSTKSSSPRLTPALKLKPMNARKISYDVFGVYMAKLGDDLPESQLNVSIVGLFYSTDPAKSHVILKVDGGEQKVYAPGDQLSAGVSLYRIHQNGIVLKRQGELESLSLPRTRLEFAPPPSDLPK